MERQEAIDEFKRLSDATDRIYEVLSPLTTAYIETVIVACQGDFLVAMAYLLIPYKLHCLKSIDLSSEKNMECIKRTLANSQKFLEHIGRQQAFLKESEKEG